MAKYVRKWKDLQQWDELSMQQKWRLRMRIERRFMRFIQEREGAVAEEVNEGMFQNHLS